MYMDILPVNVTIYELVRIDQPDPDGDGRRCSGSWLIAGHLGYGRDGLRTITVASS
jgi:hypothetical protein